MTRFLVTGRTGQLGFELIRSLQALGEVIAVGTPELDLGRPEQIPARLDALRPDVIVNAAAYTAVDRAEAEADIAMRINAEAPSAMGEWAKGRGAALVHFSTDYVFSGDLDGARREEDGTEPRSAYGRSKLAGEAGLMDCGAAAIVLRTSWVYSARGTNFVRTMLRLARERTELRVVDDQHGSPTWARTLAEATSALVARLGKDPRSIARSAGDFRGIYHLSCQGATTWFEFARAIFDAFPDDRRVLTALRPISTSEYPTAASRPRNSVLDCSRIASQFGIQMPTWDEALALLSQERTTNCILASP